jgi:2-dehydro-3-deoxyphosphogluconate aldolase/(4S)-4-hydroxy-2-oxoglutarate aldolase
MHRADLVAALQQESHGDFSTVTRDMLQSAQSYFRTGMGKWKCGSLTCSPPSPGTVNGNVPRAGSGERVLKGLQKMGLFPVVQMDESEKVPLLCTALLKGGMHIAEMTMRSPNALVCLQRAREWRDEHESRRDFLVGMGTVVTPLQAKLSIDAGADFLVSPCLNDDVAQFCETMGVLYIPGVATPADVSKALRLGLRTLKFFPAEAMGGLPALKAIAGPFCAQEPTLKFIPTGGINPENILEYTDFEAVLACGGSWMVPPNLIQDGKFDRITSLTMDALSLLAAKSH